MKNVKSILVILLLLTAISANAMPWELGVKVKNEYNQFIQRYIAVYYYDAAYKTYNYVDSYLSGTADQDGYNALFNISGISGDDSRALATLTCYGSTTQYVLKIQNKFIRFTITCGEGPDHAFEYIESTGGSATFSILYGGSAIAQGDWSNNSITLKNNMGKDNATGTIYLNSESIQTNSSGVTKTREASTFPHTISGVEQTIDNVFRKWRNWEEDLVSSISREISNPSTSTNTARYARQYTASISTSMGGGYVYVNSNQHNCPTSGAYIYDDLNNSITAPDQEYNGLSCTFSQWKESGSFKSSQNTIYYNEPSYSPSLVAEFTYKISNVGEGLYFGSSQSNPIVLYWTDNSNATGYQIWRKVRTNGVWGDPYQIATVNTGVGTYTDNDYKLNAWKQGTELEYDVRAYSSSYSQDPQWATVYGSVNSKYNESLAENILTDGETPTDYSIGNHPNPFNPTTTINYQLPNDGMVTIKVYDIIGKEVATLVNEQKSAGYYKVDFDASKLTSGVYITTIQASGFNKSIKLLLTK